jgi:hypothetical protein
MLLNALEAGYSYVQVPLTHQERAYGTSKAVGVDKIWDAQIAIIHFWWRIKICRNVQALRPEKRDGAGSAVTRTLKLLTGGRRRGDGIAASVPDHRSTLAS